MKEQREKNKLVRVNINLPQSVIEKVKEYAKSTGLNYTSAYVSLLNQAIDYHRLMKEIPIILEAYEEFKASSIENNINE